MPDSPRAPLPLPGTGRVEAFSDGIFAIAMTLLVLDLRIPRDLPPGTTLGRALLDQWPAYAAFVTSFATIAIMWVNHHILFTLIRRTDHTLLLLNALLMLGVTFVPFPTALAAGYIRHTDARTAAIVYSGTFMVLAIFFNLLWRYASHRGRLLGPETDPGHVAAVTRDYASGPVLYAASTALAAVHAAASLALIMAFAIFWALPRHRGPQRHAGASRGA